MNKDTQDLRPRVRKCDLNHVIHHGNFFSCSLSCSWFSGVSWVGPHCPKNLNFCKIFKWWCILHFTRGVKNPSYTTALTFFSDSLYSSERPEDGIKKILFILLSRKYRHTFRHFYHVVKIIHAGACLDWILCEIHKLSFFIKSLIFSWWYTEES